MNLVILTPDSQVYEGEITRISAPGVEGEFEVLTNHVPLIAALSAGTVSVKTQQDEDLTFNIKGGFMEVLHNNISLLAESIAE